MGEGEEGLRERVGIGGEDTVKEGEGKIDKDAPKGEEENGNRVYLIYQIMASLAVGLSSLGVSVAMSYTSPALPSIRSDPSFDITHEQESWVGAVMPATALVGSIMAGPLVDRLGRKATLLYLTGPFILAWSMIATSTGVGGLVGGRMLSGACVGVLTVAGSVLMPEMVELKYRNILGIMPAIFGNLGMLLCFWAGQHLSWRGLAWLGAGFCLPQLPLLLLLPETPHYLTVTGQRSKSVAALRLLRRTAREARTEQETIDKGVQQGGDGVALKQIVSGSNLWPVAVSSGMMVAQQMTGITAVVFFASSILGEGGGDVFLGVVNFIGTFVGMFCVATKPRRSLLMWSTRVVVSALLVLSVHFWVVGDSEVTGLQRLVPAAALTAYMLGFAIGWGPVPWVFLGEGMPSAVRGKAASSVVAINWGFAFIITKTFGWSIAALGPHVTFLSYAVATVLAVLMIHPNLPETYMKPTSEMDQLYLDTYAKKQQ